MKQFFHNAHALALATRGWVMHPFLLLSFLSIGAWLVAYSNGLTMSYNDAMSHLNIARLVIDNQEPGLAQIGSVWLPLNHILPLLFIWNDFAWRTGLAGSIFSMASYVISALAIYQTILLLTKKRGASIVGALAFATNFNILYLQTTPLTEPLYVALFTLSVLFFALWLIKKDNTKYLLILGVIGFFQVIARYDGWFVVAVQALLIGAHELFLRKKIISEVLGKVLLFGLPVAFGIGMWFLWNALIFGDPLFFAFGPYSAHAQQQTIEQQSGLLTKGNVSYSVLAYSFAMLYNIGEYILILAMVGVATFLIRERKKLQQRKQILLIAFLITPIFFNILALFLGFSILNLPELGWNPAGNPSGQWFNVRYGILALPFAAVLVGFFASWRKLALIIALEVIMLQGYNMYSDGIITVVDGTVGSSSFRSYAVAEKLQASVDSDDVVLMSISVFNPVAFKSQIQLKQIIHEGVSRKWKAALKTPEKYADWIVVGGDANSGDPIRQALVNKQHMAFLTHYEKTYADNEASIYTLKKKRAVSQAH